MKHSVFGNDCSTGSFLWWLEQCVNYLGVMIQTSWDQAWKRSFRKNFFGQNRAELADPLKSKATQSISKTREFEIENGTQRVPGSHLFIFRCKTTLYEWLFSAKVLGFGVLSKKLTEIPQNWWLKNYVKLKCVKLNFVTLLENVNKCKPGNLCPSINCANRNS